MSGLVIRALLLFLALIPAAALPQASENPPGIRYHGLLIRVPDLAQARRFYADTLGFAVEQVSPTMLRLVDESPIYLEEVHGPLRAPADDEARASVAFQTRDIAAATARLRARGVTFLTDQPIRVGVGLSIRFRDPFGNIHALLQQTVGEVPAFEEPEVYNTGFKHPDAATPALRAFFGRLGFVVRTERYYPPSLPVGHRDGSFAFMLHENEREEAEVRARANPDSAAVSLIFDAGDLAAVVQRLTETGVEMQAAQRFALGRRMRVVVPSGVPIEFWESPARAPRGLTNARP